MATADTSNKLIFHALKKFRFKGFLFIESATKYVAVFSEANTMNTTVIRSNSFVYTRVFEMCIFEKSPVKQSTIFSSSYNMITTVRVINNILSAQIFKKGAFNLRVVITVTYFSHVLSFAENIMALHLNNCNFLILWSNQLKFRIQLE